MSDNTNILKIEVGFGARAAQIRSVSRCSGGRPLFCEGTKAKPLDIIVNKRPNEPWKASRPDHTGAWPLTSVRVTVIAVFVEIDCCAGLDLLP